MPVARNVTGRTSDTDFGRAPSRFGTAAATSDSKKRKRETAKDEDFRIDVETDTSRAFWEITARCAYTGSDDAFVRYLDDLRLSPRSLALLTIQVFQTQQQYREHTQWKYRGRIVGFWNALTRYKDRLDQGGFPFLEKT